MLYKKYDHKLDNQSQPLSQCGKPVAPIPNNREITPRYTQSATAKPINAMIIVESGNGKRSQTALVCRTTPIQALPAAEQILRQSGFSPREYRNESVWKKGTGMLTAMQYVKLIPDDKALIVQGWVQIGIGNAGLKEQCLDGLLGAIPKKMVLKTIEQISCSV